MKVVPFLAVAALLVGAPFVVSGPTVIASAQAAEMKEFTPAAFEAAQKAGAPILVDVTAPWCPTCKAQKPIVSELTAQPKFSKLMVFHVDFDSQKDALKMLGVRMQSTLISYKGATEVGRSTGMTEKDKIAAQLDKAV